MTTGIIGIGSTAYGDISATLLGLGTTNEDIPVNHGSTSDVVLSWPSTWDQYADWNGRGDVYQIDQPIVELSFEPVSPQIKITIDRFELDEWAGGGDTAAHWSVTGSVSGVLASGHWDDFNTANDPANTGGRSTVTPMAMGVPGETLTLRFDHTGMGNVSYLAMDNLTFSSMVVPEPAGPIMAWLGVGGLGARAMRRKCRPLSPRAGRG